MRLRVLDAGTVRVPRSLSLWHGIASAMAPAAAPTLSFCRSEAAYVCLGHGSSLEEVDREACRRFGLPLLRRRIGGGPVLIEPDQLFFQLTLPAVAAPVAEDELDRVLLGPAVTALRALGLPARLKGSHDIAVGERKISGTGTLRIGEAVTVAGNLLFGFAHERMAEVLALPSEGVRCACLKLMRHHVTSLAAEGLGHVTFDEAKEALVAAYASGLGLAPAAAAPSRREEEEAAGWEARFADPEWLAGPLPAGDQRRFRVKICDGVWLYAAAEGGLAVEAALVNGRFQGVAVRGGNGSATAMGRALAGLPLAATALSECLEPFGDEGRQVAALLVPSLS